MRKIKVEELSLEAFKPYGSFANLVDCDTVKIGEQPVEFFRDMVQTYTGNVVSSFSVVKTWKRPLVIDEAEQHFYTAEALLPLDGDIIVFAGHSTNKEVPYDGIRAFYVPKDTMVTFAPGVWHKAPFPADRKVVHSLVILPERTYANDCLVVSFPDEEKIEIDF
jgi:ureidoglycolate lyase